MAEHDHGLHFFLDLCPPDTAEGAGVDRSEAVGRTNKTSVDQAHVVAASGTYHGTPT